MHSSKVYQIARLLAVVLVSSVAAADSSPAKSSSLQPHKQDAVSSASTPGASAALPPMPGGESTVMGGEIRNVDPVRDQFTLKIFGARPVTILFDARTQVYRDGQKISVLDLRPEDHASVETTLDGTKIFALAIHTLSQPPQGESRGQVLSYNPQSGELTISAALLRGEISLHVPPDTPVVRVGQDKFSAARRGTSDLIPGALVDVRFKAGSGGQGVATRVDVLATPGSVFVFNGSLSFLDLHSGRLVIADPLDKRNYQVSFDPSQLPISRELHEGSHVRVTASFNGSRYVASTISIE